MISGCKYFLKSHTIVHAKSSSVYKHSKVLLNHKFSISLSKKKKGKEKCFGLANYIIMSLTPTINPILDTNEY